MKAGLGREISAHLLISIAFLALMLSFSSGFYARAQTQATSSNSIVSSSIFSSTPISSTNTASVTTSAMTTDYSNATSTSISANLGSTSSTTLSTSNASISTSTSSIASTSASTTSSSTSYTSTNNSDVTVTMTSTTTTIASTGSSTSDTSSADYSISFSPTYWPCTDVSVTFTGPLIESGFYGDTLQFQYFQYSPSYPSVLNPIFTDPGLTVTSDNVNYWINYNEYAPVNFAYMPNVAVRVVDVTSKSNGYMPGQLFLELTNITPQGYQYCQIDSPAPIPEFQTEWIIIMVSVALGSVFLQAHRNRLVRTKK